MLQKRPISVLVAPLDWGLGHATRCIPIIKELTRQGATVVIGSSGPQKKLLSQTFPELEFLELPGYSPRYRMGNFLKWGLLLQIPTFIKQIRKENNWLNRILKNRSFDFILSDNRYGLYHKKAVCVFITHQLFIQSGYGMGKKTGRNQKSINHWIDLQILKWNYSYISKFSNCWIPDCENGLGIAGELSHPPVKAPIPVKYIGLLSRFHFKECAKEANSVIILISGPEPHRTNLEKKIIQQVVASRRQITLVRGLPDIDKTLYISENVRIFNHLQSDELNEYLNKTEFIIARSGYSTIMDLVRIKRSAILIPTPGQTEQEYLGQRLHEKKWMYCVQEQDFNLEKNLAVFKGANLVQPNVPESTFSDIIGQLLINSRAVEK